MCHQCHLRTSFLSLLSLRHFAVYCLIDLSKTFNKMLKGSGKDILAPNLKRIIIIVQYIGCLL